MKRLLRIRWLLPVILVIALLGTWQWYATRPTLVWWTSPPDDDGYRVRALVPVGWRLETYSKPPYDCLWQAPESKLPEWLQWFGFSEPSGTLSITVRIHGYHASGPLDKGFPEGQEILAEQSSFIWRAFRAERVRGKELLVFLSYEHPSKRAFDATHSAICNSLRIE